MGWKSAVAIGVATLVIGAPFMVLAFGPVVADMFRQDRIELDWDGELARLQLPPTEGAIRLEFEPPHPGLSILGADSTEDGLFNVESCPTGCRLIVLPIASGSRPAQVRITYLAGDSDHVADVRFT